jgi:hypothetical protein
MSQTSFVSPARVFTQSLLQGATTTGGGMKYPSYAGMKTYQASGTTSAGTGSAVINVEGSNDGASWDVIGTITLTLGTPSTSDSFSSNDRYQYVRGNVTALTGTSATVNLTQGY